MHCKVSQAGKEEGKKKEWCGQPGRGLSCTSTISLSEIHFNWEVLDRAQFVMYEVNFFRTLFQIFSKSAVKYSIPGSISNTAHSRFTP